MRSHRLRSMNNATSEEVPYGILALQTLGRECCPRLRRRRKTLYKASIFLLTYLAYCCFHMTRKPISVVKSVLHYNCSAPRFRAAQASDSDDCGFAPFDVHNAQELFGLLDSAFLFTYAFAMFISGVVAERVSLRYFLSIGMIASSIFVYMFGIAKTFNIHSLWYFVFVQAMAGIFQTTGWPGVVTLIGRWFGKSKRGLVYGIWNSHTSIGNILGTLIAAAFVETDWALSFVVPGIIMGIVGFLLFLFLVDHPELVGIYPHVTPPQEQEQWPPNETDVEEAGDYEAKRSYYGCCNENSEVNYRPTERTPILDTRNAAGNHLRPPIHMYDAIFIPGVIEFSLCLFFSKLVSYTFLYWLPFYIQSSSTLGPSSAADLSTLFDVGGIVGAIIAGAISDHTGMSATTCAGMLFLACPALILYQHYGAVSLTISAVLLIIVGFLVNGPYALITTSVAAELGQHSSLQGNAKALATVTAIIDGTGSIGAAVGPLLAGLISHRGWQNVFHMLIIANICAMLLLVRLVTNEFAKLRRIHTRVRVE